MRKILISLLLILSAAFSYAAKKADYFDKFQSRIIQASDVVKDHVVHIEVITRQNQKTLKVQGSGLIVDSLGHVITNEHVVEKAEKITISVSGIEDKFNASIVGTDKMTDLALLKMEHPIHFSKIKWADIKKVRVGDWAIAIGNPYGLDRTVSLGIISAKGRAVHAEGLLNDFIQTDAMIDIGSSGGPLINLRGEVLGINSMIMGRGIGFTVPTDVVQEVFTKLQNRGKIERSWIGIGIQPLNQDFAEYFKIPDKKGVIITGIFDNSPANKAKLKAGEIIVSVDGEQIIVEKEEDLTQFQRKIADHKIGDKVKLEVYCPDKKKLRTVKIKTVAQPSATPKEMDIHWGFLVKEITPLLHRENFLFSMDGVVVSYVRNGSEAHVAGLYTWDIIQKIEDIPIKNIDDFKKAYRKLRNRNKVMLKVQRNRDTFFVLIQKYGTEESD